MPPSTALQFEAGTDTDLARLAGRGDANAFDELYRRHVDAAYRVARAVTRHADDAADAVSEAFTKVFTALPTSTGFSTGFRPYLLATTRNASIDILRRRGRSIPSEPQTFDRPDNKAGPAGALIAGADSAMVISALETLPERWRTILWLTEVEGLKPGEAAPVMGLTANGASQLAVRARAGLREAYLQAHLRTGVGAACSDTVPLLGAYVAGALSARDLSKVDQHLAGCSPCRDRVVELEEVSDRLRRVVVPLPLALAGAGGGLAASLGLTGGSQAGGASLISAGLSDRAQSLIRPLQKPLLYASVGLFALGIMAVAIVGGPKGKDGIIDSRPSPVAGSPSPARLEDGSRFALPILFGNPISPAALAAGAAADPGPAGGIGAPGGTGGSGAGGTTAPPPPKPEPATPLVNFDARVGPAGTLGVSAGAGNGSCTGATVGGTSAGCTPPSQEQGRTATVATGGSVLGKNKISI